MTLLILAERTEDGLHEATPRLIKAATAFNEPAELVVLDRAEGLAAETASRLTGIDKVVHIEHPHPDSVTPDQLAALVLPLITGHSAVFAADLGLGRSVLPLVAAQLRIAPVTGVSSIIDRNTFERPIYAGAITERVRHEASPLLLTIRAMSFAPVAEGPPAPVEKIAGTPPAPLIEIVGRNRKSADRPALESAKVVIGAGRGVGTAENYAELELLADRLHAALGASRIAVDMGLAPHVLQIGQTGRKIAPDLYIAVGISGAVQHLAGIKDAGTIVALNKDPDAPIFKFADYGLIGDANHLVPALLKALKNAP